jgi:hypothetical protein
VLESTETDALWADTDAFDQDGAVVCRSFQNAHVRTNATRMRIIKIIIALIACVFGCTAVPERVVHVEHAVVKNEQRLVGINSSYDLSEQDLGRMRLSVFDLVERGRMVSQQLEMAAREYEYATAHYHLASNELARAARNYEIAAAEYEMVAALIVRVASSKNLIHSVCGRSADVDGLQELMAAYGVNTDSWDMKRSKMPLPALNELLTRAIKIILCRT